MDEFDRVNPFDAAFRLDDETATPTTSFPGSLIQQQWHHRHYHHQHQHYRKKKTGKPLVLLLHWEKPAATSSLKSSGESINLATVNQLITIWQWSNYRVQKQSFKFHSFSVEDIKTFRDEIKKIQEREHSLRSFRWIILRGKRKAAVQAYRMVIAWSINYMWAWARSKLVTGQQNSENTSNTEY